MIDRQAFYDRRAPARLRESQRYYHRLSKKYFAFLITPHRRVLEAGCGLGDLLAATSPSFGMGIDFSPAVIQLARQRYPQLHFEAADALFLPPEQFDYIVLSDLVNDLPDVQVVLERLHQCASAKTRLILSFFNNLWRPILYAAEKLGLKAPTLQQNWLSRDDMKNLLGLAGWEVIKIDTKILCPVFIPWLSWFLNRWLAPLLPDFCLTIMMVARPAARAAAEQAYSCSVIVPARNEAGNIQEAFARTPEMGLGTELIFIEGHSHDETWEEIQRVAALHPERKVKILKQRGKGKGSAVREAFAAATGDLLFILDADLTIPPEQLSKFYEAARSGRAEFVNGVRLVYPLADDAMQFWNMVGNKFFSLAFTWLLGQPIKDTLCGTKVIFRSDYENLQANRAYFGEFDPFGDFDLLFGAAKLNLRIVDLPIRYQARKYGETNIQRWRHGWLLLRMVIFAARRLKFI